MPDAGAEEAMRAICDLLLQGDMFSAMSYLTPEAIAEAMSIGSGVATLPMPTSYSIESQDEVEGEQRFRVRFETSQGPINARASWRLIDGAWRVTSLGVENPG